MNATDLHQWCKGKHGRMADLAKKLGISKQAVFQWAVGKRSIHPDRVLQIQLAMSIIERKERK